MKVLVELLKFLQKSRQVLSINILALQLANPLVNCGDIQASRVEGLKGREGCCLVIFVGITKLWLPRISSSD